MTSMKKILFAAVLLAAVIGCSKKSSTAPETPTVTAAEDLASGWIDFGNGSFSAAQAHFESALGKDGSLADAYNGKGWCQAILRSPATALGTFRSGLAQAAANNEIKAGMAFTYSALDSVAPAIGKALEVLSADSLWQFAHVYKPSAHDNVLNYKEVALLLAQNYFKAGQFGSSLTWVQKLNPGYSIDIATTAGQAALQAEIERLGDTI
jgi:tetratricopeptide (TPR) repeat protein